MWKLYLVALAAFFWISGCLDPGCMRNSECAYGLECRANKCQKPLPPQPVGGMAAAQCYAYWCPYVQDGGQLHYAGIGGHADVNTSTRYQDGGTAVSSTVDAGSPSGSASGAGGSM